MDINIPGIDLEKAIKNSGSEQLLTELFGDVYKIMDEKSDLIETYIREKDLQNFTVQVHALKTTCRMIGAIDLGEDFFTLEKLGKENNLEQIEKLAPDVLSSFRSLKPYLEPYAIDQKGEGARNEFDKDKISSILSSLVEAIDNFDLGAAEEATRELHSFSCNDDLSGKLEALDKLVTNLDYDEAKDLIGQIRDSL